MSKTFLTPTSISVKPLTPIISNVMFHTNGMTTVGSKTYGLDNWKPWAQEIGGIEAREGRLVNFPNTFHHQVRPFHLADPMKPGHRKILVLFLVDPNIKIVSTANVSCQRHDWWAQMILGSNVLEKLPLELRDILVRDFDEFPISLDQARKLREELMEERRKFVIGILKLNFQSTKVSLCEN